MKNIIKIAFLVLTLSLIVSCAPTKSGEQSGGGGENPDGVDFVIKATVKALGEKIEVDVFEGEYASGIYWVITSEQTEFIDKSGNKITKDDINVGDTVEIVYNGQVMMSYPAQIAARKITVL